MIKKLVPNLILNSIFEIDAEKLKKNNIKVLIFDIDNTLAIEAEEFPNDETVLFLNRLMSEGIKICFVSNNSKARVEKFNSKFGFYYIFKARKPFSKSFKSVLNKFKEEIKDLEFKNLCMVGDQLFTDILGANHLGIFTLLVLPINPKEHPLIRIKRIFENIIIKNYIRRIK